MTRKLPSRVRRPNIQSTAIRRESLKMSSKLGRIPKGNPKNQLSSWRRVDSQKSMELLVLYRRFVTLLRAHRTAARDERLSCPVLAKLRMVRLFSCFCYFDFLSDIRKKNNHLFQDFIHPDLSFYREHPSHQDKK